MPRADLIRRTATPQRAPIAPANVWPVAARSPPAALAGPARPLGAVAGLGPRGASVGEPRARGLAQAASGGRAAGLLRGDRAVGFGDPCARCERGQARDAGCQGRRRERALAPAI